MTFNNPLDLWNILINNLAGSVDIFVGIAIIALMGLAAYFRMTTFTSLILGALFFIILSPFIGNIYMALVVLISGILIGNVLRWLITK